MDQEKRMAGDYIIIASLRVGDREVIIGEDPNAAKGEKFMCGLGQRTDLFVLYEDCMVSDDYLEIAELFGKRINGQVEKTRDEFARHAPCEIKISDQLPNGFAAAYVPEEKVIHIRQGMDAPDIFRSLSQELAHAHLDKGSYKRGDCAFTAYCASYMLCRRYGIPTDQFRFDRVPESLRGMDAKTIRTELGRIRDVSNDISASMSRVLEPQQRSQKSRDNGAR